MLPIVDQVLFNVYNSFQLVFTYHHPSFKGLLSNFSNYNSIKYKTTCYIVGGRVFFMPTNGELCCTIFTDITTVYVWDCHASSSPPRDECYQRMG